MARNALRAFARPAFSRADLIATLTVVSVAGVTFATALDGARNAARDGLSEANLKTIGQAAEAFAGDNAGNIFTFDLELGQQVTLANGQRFFAGNDRVFNAQRQEWDILMRTTGRFNGNNDIQRNTSTLPHARMRHIRLVDHLGGALPEPVFASPHDTNLLQWQADPTNTDAGFVPSPGGQPGLTDPAFQERWAYGSSYASTTYAWSADVDGVVPSGTAHPPFQLPNQNPDLLGVRTTDEVASPAGKVHLFEEFDRTRDQVWAYDDSTVPQLFFDGSVRTNRTDDANPGWDPRSPRDTDLAYTFFYAPIDPDFFPPARFDDDGDGVDDTAVSGRFLWTRGGLRGIDYGSDEIDTTNWPD